MNQRVLFLLAAIGVFGSACNGASPLQMSPEISWALALPDGAPLDSPEAEVWRSAAAEEGYSLAAIHDSDLLRPWSWLGHRYPVVIFPDGLHTESPPLLIEKLRSQLEQGDTILLSSEAFSKNYPGGALSSLCETAGTDFGYKAARFGMLSSPLELGSEDAATPLRQLIPPGSWAGDRLRWVGYQAAEKNVAHTVTTGAFPGKIQALDLNGETLLGTVNCGPGKIVFANLPLTYLKTRTDGSLLHATLKLVDRQAAPSARLLPTPDGLGGIVFNIHVDSNAAIKPLQQLDRQGFFSFGPFSVHVTAGPDARTPGDHLGFDLDSRPEAKQFLARLAAQGHAIGSHGGWIHDYFGKNLTATPQEPYLTYLRLNFESLQRATGHPITEYSAPIGNHPAWVTHWLEQHGVLAYYTTGNSGLGPTRTYLDGRRLEDSSWAFPINTLGTWASLEEFHAHHYTRAQVLSWLKQLSSFAATSHEARLFYSHPPGIQDYAPEIFEWLRYSQRLEVQGAFRWYRMSDLARFLTRREKARWSENEGRAGSRVFEAASDETLSQLAWCLPKSRYQMPEVQERHAEVTQDERCWLVRAGDFKELKFTARSIAVGPIARVAPPAEDASATAGQSPRFARAH